jgi:hypothetical protein
MVCLEYRQNFLYGEMIQVISSRQRAWVRPLLLSLIPSGGPTVFSEPDQQPLIYDLRQGADLLWPLGWFRPALDTEVLQLLAQLQPWDEGCLTEPERMLTSHHQLQQFMLQVWQAQPEAFIR